MSDKTIYAWLTSDGAPINETALCEMCLMDDLAVESAASLGYDADDFHRAEWLEVAQPEHNDTRCVECAVIAEEDRRRGR